MPPAARVSTEDTVDSAHGDEHNRRDETVGLSAVRIHIRPFETGIFIGNLMDERGFEPPASSLRMRFAALKTNHLQRK